MQRRGALKALPIFAISVSLAGCTGGNSKVVKQYEAGHILFQTAKSTESAGDDFHQANEEQLAHKKWKNASNVYSSAAGKFKSAKSIAESDEVRQYCERARKLANIKSKEMADLGQGNTQAALTHTRKSQEHRFRVADVEKVRDAVTGFF